MTKLASFIIQATLGTAVGVVIVYAIAYALLRALEVVLLGGR